MSTSEHGPAGTQAQVGFIGLGVMGYPMAGHLAAAGLGLTCFDTDPAMRDRMRDAWPAAGVADDVAAVGAGKRHRDHDAPRRRTGPAGRARHRWAHRLDGRRFDPARLLVGPTLADARRRRAQLAANGDQDGRCARVGRAVGRRSRRAGVHGRRRGRRRRAGAPVARPARAGNVPRRADRLGPRDEEHQQRDHGDDVPRDRRGPGARHPGGPRPGGDERRAQRVDRRIVDHPEPHRAADPEPHVRRPVPARVDAQGRRHRHPALPRPRVCRSRSSRCARASIVLPIATPVRDAA